MTDTESMYRELTGAHSQQCLCNRCIETRMAQIREAVTAEIATKYNRAYRVCYAACNALLALCALAVVYMAGVGTLPWLFAAVTVFMLYLVIRCNVREARRYA